jgi:hypothetical protein
MAAGNEGDIGWQGDWEELKESKFSQGVIWGQLGCS